MSRIRLRGSAAAVAIAAAGGAAMIVAGGVALAQQAADAPAAVPLSDIPAPAPLVEERDPIAEIAAADAAAARAAAAPDEDPAEAEAAAAEEEDAPEETEVDRRGPNALGIQGSEVAQSPERRIGIVLTQGFAFDSDPSLDGSGSTFSSDTTFSASYISRAPTSSLSLGLDGSLRLLAGDGADDDDTAVPLPSFRASYSASLSRTTSFSTSFRASVSQTAFENQDEINLVLTDEGIGLVRVEGDEGNAQRLTLSGSASLSHSINRRNSVSGSVSLTRSDFLDNDSDSLAASTFGSISGGWTHQAHSTLSTTFSASLSGSRSEAADEAQSLTFSTTAGGAWRVNRLLSVNGELGPSLTFSDEITTDGSDGSDMSVGVRARAGLSYAGRRTSVNLSLSNNVVPSDGGEISNLTAVAVGGSLRVNDVSSFGGQIGISMQRPLGEDDGTGDVLSFNSAVSYSYALTETVNANLGYGLRWRTEDGEADMSHRVFLTLSRSFTFLP